MVQKIKNRFYLATLLAIVAVGFSGCEKPFALHADLDVALDAEYTGGLTEDGKLLTAASDDGGIQILKEAIDIKAGGNAVLAAAIQSTQIERLDSNSKPTLSTPDQMKIRVTLRDKSSSESTLAFSVKMKAGQGEGSVFSATVATAHPAYRLAGVCSDKVCSKVVLRLTKNTRSESAEAGIIHRAKQNAQLRMSGSSSEEIFKSAPSLNPVRQTLLSGPKSTILETQEVAWGTANFLVRMGTDPNTALCLTGRFVETNEDDETLKVGLCSGKPSSVSAMMIGNDNAGSMIVRLQERSAMMILLIVSEAKVLADLDGKAPVDAGEAPPVAQESQRLPSNPNHSITRILESDRTRSEVVEVINKWTSKNNSPVNSERMRQFIARIQPNLSVLKSSLEKFNVPTEMMAITAIESNYFAKAGYPLDVNSESSAAGPWQFVDDTARDQGLKIFSTAKAKTLNACDQRGSLALSTQAAGKYFSKLFKKFPQDPRLGILSYYWGQGHVQCLGEGDLETCAGRLDRDAATPLAKKVARLQAIRAANFNFWTVKTFNMGRKDAPAYVIRFIAAQFVAREPKRYGISLISADEVAKIPAAQDPVCK